MEQDIIRLALNKIDYCDIDAYFNKDARGKKLTWDLFCSVPNGQKMVNKYGGLYKLVVTVYPTYTWGLTHFKKPNHLKDDVETNRNLLLNVLNTHGHATFQAFFNSLAKNIGYDEIMAITGGSSLLSNCNRSPLQLFQKWVPEYDWTGFHFKNLPQNFFNDEEKTRWLKEFEFEQGILEPDGWYKVTAAKIMEKEKGVTLYGKFDSSTINIMRFLYPDYNWCEWLIETGAPNGFWNERENQQKFMLWLGNKLKFVPDHWTLDAVVKIITETKENWYKVLHKDMVRFGSGLFDKYDNNLLRLFNEVFPFTTWDDMMFVRHNTEKEYGMYLNSLSDTQYIHSFKIGIKKQRELPFDFGNKILKEIHEVDGDQHFRDVPSWMTKHEVVRKNDIEKMKYAIKEGYKVIRISQMDIYKNKIDCLTLLKKLKETLMDTDVCFISHDPTLYDQYIKDLPLDITFCKMSGRK